MPAPMSAVPQAGWIQWASDVKYVKLVPKLVFLVCLPIPGQWRFFPVNGRFFSSNARFFPNNGRHFPVKGFSTFLSTPKSSQRSHIS